MASFSGIGAEFFSVSDIGSKVEKNVFYRGVPSINNNNFINNYPNQAGFSFGNVKIIFDKGSSTLSINNDKVVVYLDPTGEITIS